MTPPNRSKGSEGNGKVPEFVTELNKNDVLLGRGAPIIQNEGNVRFRKLVEARREKYRTHKKHREKNEIALEIVNIIAQKKGRFLRPVASLGEAQRLGVEKGTKAWVPVDSEVALGKVKQALRGKEFQGERERNASTSSATTKPSRGEEEKEPALQALTSSARQGHFQQGGHDPLAALLQQQQASGSGLSSLGAVGAPGASLSANDMLALLRRQQEIQRLNALMALQQPFLANNLLQNPATGMMGLGSAGMLQQGSALPGFLPGVDAISSLQAGMLPTAAQDPAALQALLASSAPTAPAASLPPDDATPAVPAAAAAAPSSEPQVDASTTESPPPPQQQQQDSTPRRDSK